jgi:hypothetical protein
VKDIGIVMKPPDEVKPALPLSGLNQELWRSAQEYAGAGRRQPKP